MEKSMDFKPGGLENLILNVIWDNTDSYNGLMSVNQVWEKLNLLNTNKKWAYTTVKTVLDRLVEKGLLDRVKSGKKFNYCTIMPRNEMAEKALKKVALEYFSNDFLAMTKFVKEMAYQEEKNLVNVYR